MHTFTHQWRCQPRKVPASSSGAVRVRCRAQGHLNTLGGAGDQTRNLPVTSQPERHATPPHNEESTIKYHRALLDKTHLLSFCYFELAPTLLRNPNILMTSTFRKQNRRVELILREPRWVFPLVHCWGSDQSRPVGRGCDEIGVAVDPG